MDNMPWQLVFEIIGQLAAWEIGWIVACIYKQSGDANQWCEWTLHFGFLFGSQFQIKHGFGFVYVRLLGVQFLSKVAGCNLLRFSSCPSFIFLKIERQIIF